MSVFSESSRDLRAPLWIGLIALLSVAFSAAFACATPFAAFAAAAALTLTRTQAFAMVAAAWFANQFAGYAFLGYPVEAQSLVWGAAIGAASLIATYATIKSLEMIANKTFALRFIVAIIVAALAYQAVMLFAALALDGMAGNTLAIVARITAIDVAAFALLITAHVIGKTVDIVPEYNTNYTQSSN